jgi:hypothetical protein
MKYIFASFLLPFYLGLTSIQTLAGEYKSQSSSIQNSSSSPNGSFYTVAKKLLQEQFNLVARIEIAFAQPDPNRVRAANGQIFVQAKAIEAFVKRQDSNFQNTCNSYQLPTTQTTK